MYVYCSINSISAANVIKKLSEWNTNNLLCIFFITTPAKSSAFCCLHPCQPIQKSFFITCAGIYSSNCLQDNLHVNATRNHWKQALSIKIVRRPTDWRAKPIWLYSKFVNGFPALHLCTKCQLGQIQMHLIKNFYFVVL